MEHRHVGRRCVCLAGLLVVVGPFAVAADNVEFERDVLPLLYARCFSCHSQKKTEPAAGLRLDSAAVIRESGVVVAGQPEESELLRRISRRYDDEDLMPPLLGGGRPLNDNEQMIIRQWIASGAETGRWERFDHREAPVDFRAEQLDSAEIPTLAQRVDQLVQIYHRRQGTGLNPPINDEAFLRRVYLDVAGRIPSYAESRKFLDNSAPDKRAQLIHQLLNSQGYVSHTFNWKADQLRLVTLGLQGQPGWLYDDWVREAIRSHKPYDEYVYELITASGYMWENGAVGFYVRDRGMPLDHLSNTVRVFLGTRIECAQCHDHPFEPITQDEYYQLAAYTYGVSNLTFQGGYHIRFVKHWDELQRQLNAQNASAEERTAVSRSVSNLKRFTTDTEKRLAYPADYPNDLSLRGQPVPFRTPFGDEAPADIEDRREAFAGWMVSPRNPRFSKNLANRLWKRVMGVGLIEPVDSLSPVNQPSHPELLDFLSQTAAQLDYDERGLLAVLLNTRLYQSESIRQVPSETGADRLRGPLLRRLAAEQLWDSLLVLLVQDLDERRSLKRYDTTRLSRDHLSTLSRMTADELMQRSREEMFHRRWERERTKEMAALDDAIAKAQGSGDGKQVRQLVKHQSLRRREMTKKRNAIQMGERYFAEETDPRWRGLDHSLVRASELPTPVELGHFLRQFGQSDRREIDASSTDANITHGLALMNGPLTNQILKKESWLRESLDEIDGDEPRVRAIYQSVLIRQPTSRELQTCLMVFETSQTPEQDLIWALLNSPEFLFNQ